MSRIRWHVAYGRDTALYRGWAASGPGWEAEVCQRREGADRPWLGWVAVVWTERPRWRCEALCGRSERGARRRAAAMVRRLAVRS